jgi:hypothetical protein
MILKIFQDCPLSLSSALSGTIFHLSIVLAIGFPRCASGLQKRLSFIKLRPLIRVRVCPILAEFNAQLLLH